MVRHRSVGVRGNGAPARVHPVPDRHRRARTLSVEPTYLPRVRALVADIDLQEAEAEAMLSCTTLTDVEEVMGERLWARREVGELL